MMAPLHHHYAYPKCFLATIVVLLAVQRLIVSESGVPDSGSPDLQRVRMMDPREESLHRPLVVSPWPRQSAGRRRLKQQEGGSGAVVSQWKYDGLLASDGSISTAQLLKEPDHFAAGSASSLNTDEEQKSRSSEVVSGRSSNSSSEQNTHPPLCPATLRDLVPCSSSAASGHLYGRNCSRGRGRQRCAIPAPANYGRQFKWPSSKNQVRIPNVPNVPLLRSKEWQAWLRFRGSTAEFVAGEPHFPNGTSEHFDDLERMVPELRLGKRVRVVLDMGCGAGNVAAALEMRGIITLSVAGEGSPANGVQLVLERGYPGLIQALDRHRLPYPSQAFDLLHCAACDVPWESDGGLMLLEADRILRAGGFFVWVDPSEAGAGMANLAKQMCWEMIGRQGRVSVWQKPTNQTCYSLLPLPTLSMCNDSMSPDTSWNVPLQNCLFGFPESGAAITDAWPMRLDSPPPRLKKAPAAGLRRAKAEVYKADLNYWKHILDFYVRDFGDTRVHDIRNVLDMNAGYGGFAAAVSLMKPALQWWVLNVVPIDKPDRIAVIFDRGLLGVYHDWCEALDLHPRSFDLVHSSGLFSSKRSSCRMVDIVQEMDRLLRPGGFALIRDQRRVLLRVQTIASTFHWKTSIDNTESGPEGKDKVLNCQKRFWQS